MDKEQIQAMKRQLEEEFKMDMAALDRLERRFLNHRESAPAASAPPPPSNVQVLETRTTQMHKAEPKPEPKAEEPPQPSQDELEGTLRSMFSNYRK